MEIHDFIRQNKDSCIAFAVITVVFLLGAWLCYDHGRNAAIHDGTDGTVERIESGIEAAGQRIDSAAAAVSKAETSVSAAIGAIEASENAAGAIAEGIAECESRLDAVAQRQGRINNLIETIEREHRQRTQNIQAADLAK